MQTSPDGVDVWLALDAQRERLIRTAQRLGFSRFDAEDLVSDAIIRIATFRDLDPLRIPQIAITAVRNRCIDERRHECCLRKVEDLLAAMPDGPVPQPEDIVSSRAACESLWQTISAYLSDAELQVFRLAVQRFPHAEIATMTGVTRRASEVALSRARAKISRALDEPS